MISRKVSTKGQTRCSSNRHSHQMATNGFSFKWLFTKRKSQGTLAIVITWTMTGTRTLGCETGSEGSSSWKSCDIGQQKNTVICVKFSCSDKVSIEIWWWSVIIWVIPVFTAFQVKAERFGRRVSVQLSSKPPRSQLSRKTYYYIDVVHIVK